MPLTPDYQKQRKTRHENRDFPTHRFGFTTSYVSAFHSFAGTHYADTTKVGNEARYVVDTVRRVGYGFFRFVSVVR